MYEFLKLLSEYNGCGSSLVYGEWNDFICNVDEDDEDEEEDDDEEGEEDSDEGDVAQRRDTLPSISTEIAQAGPLDGYKVECVDQHGGEGQGDTIYAVYSVEKDGKQLGFFKAHGWYASYDGATLEDICEVTPREKTITVYDEVGCEGEDEDE